MSDLLAIQELLRDTSAALAHFEQAVAEQPDSFSLAVMLKSFEKRQRQLQAEFQKAAQQVGVDACSYRFFSDFVRPTVTPLCKALADFQHLYSAAYDAIKTGPKKTSRKLPPDVLDESSFFFGYSFSGSVGIVLTMDNSKRSLFESALDSAMQAVFELATCRSANEVRDHGRRLGVPVIRAVHKWAADHAEAALGADIEWKKGQQVVARLTLQVSELAILSEVIGGTSEVIEDTIELLARLAGADVDKRTFHLQLDDGGDLRGTFSELIPADRTFEVGARHLITLRKKVRVYYSTDREEVANYQLLMAVAVKPGQSALLPFPDLANEVANTGGSSPDDTP